MNPVAESSSCLFSPPPSESTLASQLALFQRHVTSVPIQLGWCLYHMTQAWPVIRLHRPLVPEHAVSLSLLSNLNQIGSCLLDRPHIPSQSAQQFTLQMSSQQLQQQPSANTKAGKPQHPLRQPSKHNATSGKSLQQILPGRQSGSLTIS